MRLSYYLFQISLLGLLSFTAAKASSEFAYTSLEQHAQFPYPEVLYSVPLEEKGLGNILKERIKTDPFNLIATIIFFLAIIHTFMATWFTKRSHLFEKQHQENIEKNKLRGIDKPYQDAQDHVSYKAKLFHLLGEIEVVFGLWLIPLAIVASLFYSWHDFVSYLDKDVVFIEPLFVVVIMAIAASRPILRFAENIMANIAKLGKQSPGAWWFTILTLSPILGSFITEPAAMTIGAVLLARKFFIYKPSVIFQYATLGLLFVNISIGGTLTQFAAPPVLIVARKWGWEIPDMLANFGWKAICAILVSNLIYFLFFRKEFAKLNVDSDESIAKRVKLPAWENRETFIPTWITYSHLAFLAWTIINAHYPPLFIGGFLFFMGFNIITSHHQNPINIKTPLLVGFFLASLIAHGSCQSWWLSPVIINMPNQAILVGSAILTAFNDNAAITYLASQVDGLSINTKYAVVAGALTGGGLTVIANAPNPAGQSILGKHFKDGISPLKLLLAALIPTIIAYFAFSLLPSLKPLPDVNSHLAPQTQSVKSHSNPH